MNAFPFPSSGFIRIDFPISGKQRATMVFQGLEEIPEIVETTLYNTEFPFSEGIALFHQFESWEMDKKILTPPRMVESEDVIFIKPEIIEKSDNWIVVKLFGVSVKFILDDSDEIVEYCFVKNSGVWIWYTLGVEGVKKYFDSDYGFVGFARNFNYEDFYNEFQELLEEEFAYEI